MGNMLGTIQEASSIRAPVYGGAPAPSSGGAPAPPKPKKKKKFKVIGKASSEPKATQKPKYVYQEGYAPTYALPGGIAMNRHETEKEAIKSAKKYPHRVKAIVKRKVRRKGS